MMDRALQPRCRLCDLGRSPHTPRRSLKKTRRRRRCRLPTPQPEPKVLRKSDSFKMEKRLDLQIEEPTAQVTRAVGEPPAPEPLETPTAAEVERTLEAGV